MKILFLTTDMEDYLADGLLHGLRMILGDQVVDFPKAERLYSTCLETSLKRVRGRAFTLYGLLPNISIDRSHICQRIRTGEFNLIIFSRIWYQYGEYLQYMHLVKNSQVVILDGEDSAALYPYAGNFLRRPELWFLPRVHRKHLYFKREWTLDTMSYRSYRLIPARYWSFLPASSKIRPISFSIPEEKIISSLPAKIKDWPKHIVDSELASRVGGATSYSFANELDYYSDLQNSRFGVTTKRSGWDCLRHYELASQGCVLCFKDLDAKLVTCAPHGLDKSNAISYRDADELISKIKMLSSTEIEQMQLNSLAWAKCNTTKQRAKEFLNTINEYNLGFTQD